jgi:uncharacterized protein YoxC
MNQMTDRELLELLVKEVTGIKSTLQEIKESQSKAETKLNLVYNHTVKLTEDMTMLSGKMDQGFSDVIEVQKSLLEMYGDHEAAIRILRRRPV